MSEIKIHQVGDSVRSKTGNLLHSIYFGQMFNNKISVPVEVTSSRFMLDFRETLAGIFEDRESLSQELQEVMIGLLVRAKTSLDTEKIIQTLEDMGAVPPDMMEANGTKIKMSGEERLRDSITKMQDNIASHTVRSGLSNIIVQDVLGSLSEAGSAGLQLKKLGSVTMTDVGTTVHEAQVFWNAFASRAAGDTLATELAARSRDNTLLTGCKAMYSLFRSGTGAHVEARENYVYDELFKAISGDDNKPLVPWNTVMENKIYKVGASQMEDIGFVDAVSAFMWSCSTIMGLSATLKGGDSRSLETTINQQVLGIDTQQFFVPTEAGTVNVDSLSRHYELVYKLHLIRRFTNDDPGVFFATVMNGVQNNRFFDAKGMEQIFHEELYCLSIAYEAFIDTANYYRGLYKSNTVLFTDWKHTSPKKREMIVKQIEEHMFKDAKVVMKSADHPAYFTQKAHLFKSESTSFSTAPMFGEPYVDNTQWAQLPWERVVSDDKETSHLRRIGGLPVLNGSWWDFPIDKLPFDRTTIQTREPIVPTFMFKVAVTEDAMANDVVRAKYATYPKSEMIKQLKPLGTGMTLLIKKMGEERHYLDPADLARKMRLPIEIANAIWDSAPVEEWGGKEFWDLSAMSGILFIFDEDAAEYYEYSEFPGNHATEAWDMLPFVAKYPVVMEQNDALFRTIDTIAIKDDNITFTPRETEQLATGQNMAKTAKATDPTSGKVKQPKKGNIGSPKDKAKTGDTETDIDNKDA